MSEADSLTEVIRLALSIYEILLTAIECGDRIILRSKDNDRELLIR